MSATTDETRRTESSAIRSVALVAALVAVCFATALAQPAMQPGAGMAPPAVMTQLAGPDRVVLVVLPAEPFYTQQQVDAQHLTDGMVAVGGATPVPPDAPSHPNHHLVVHIYDRTTGEALRGAHVTMKCTPASGATAGSGEVPVVEMQAVGKGPGSTHYGNNVTLAPGIYIVTVTVNGDATATFVVNV